MRAVVVDWLVVLQDNYELNHETLYLAVRIMDTFLAKTSKRISKQQFQLVAATAIFISAKLEERMPPPIDELLYACDNSYTSSELVEMELEICRATEFNFNLPLSYSFLRRFAKCLKLPMDLLTLARYILEVSLMSVEFTTELESFLAAGALRLALVVTGRREWTRTFEHYSGYNVETLAPLCKRLHAGLQAAYRPKVTTIKDKYSHEVFFKVAARIAPEQHDEAWYVSTTTTTN
jgi:cyclin B